MEGAAALDTGAIESLYGGERGFTFTVAFDTAAWEVELAKKGENVRPLCVGDQVAGQNLGGFGVRGGEAAGDIRQGHRGDRRVQNFHESWKHHGNCDQPRVYPLGERIVSPGASAVVMDEGNSRG